MPNRPLTDEEICRKFEITKDDPYFSLVRLLSDNRPDRTICEIPEVTCPHCGHEFTATFYDLGSNDPANGNEMPCEGCERIIYIEHIAEPEDGNDEGPVFVTLSTHPEPPK